MATTEVTPKVEPKKDTVASNGSPEPAKKKDSSKDSRESPKDPIKVDVSTEPADGEPTESRKSGYVCPYCRLSCAKPSVLQKHIRAHTNERPYPCIPCGFAFKTKSNLYKHCRSRAHALKMEGGDASKVSEDSDISLSDSASNGTGTPPPPPSSTPTTTVSVVKTIKTGKIYKPKFHTALQCVNNDIETSSLSSASSTNSSSSTNAATTPKPNPEQVQEHIDKIITDNQAIVDAVDPRLHKLIQRQQSLVEPKQSDQPLNLSSAEEASRKRCYMTIHKRCALGFVQESKDCPNGGTEGSIIKDLLLKNPNSSQNGTAESESYVYGTCNIPYSSIDNLDVHRMYYCKDSVSPRRDYQMDIEKRDPDFDSKSSDYYNTLQPLPSPGPLLGNTRLVDAYVPPVKKQRSESVPTTLRSLEELSKYPRPNSLQMFGGEVRILDNTGETKTMRIEPRQTNSPTSEQIVSSKCVTSETASIVVRSGLHSGGTMVHKPPGTPARTPSSSISLPNTPKMLAPIIPNISTPNIAPSMSCYNYLEPHLNPLTSITAYSPLTLPQPGITNILHGGKVIPYVPGMPGPHTLTPAIDISSSVATSEPGYKSGLSSVNMIPQPLDLASPVKIQTPSAPRIPGPMPSGHVPVMGQPLDLTSPAKDTKLGFKTPGNENVLKIGLTSPKVPTVKTETSTDKYRRVPSTGEIAKVELDRHIKNSMAIKYKGMARPTSLPLKPGTFTPKKHHGITPTANTLPLISPDTPRPKKSYGQLYLNGHAYTYLGLKCSTRVFYCTLNKPQPMYVTQQHGLSMYSNWKICEEAPPDVDMVHYDSRHRPLNYTTAWKKQEDILTHSSQRPTTPTSSDSGLDSDMQEKAKRVKIFEGGFESNEDYTYVRGRGRGRYVCEECGIRCKKPSMLKKHIRTHTDVRPYTCKHCAFSFKTKGNLTKHMKSKAHYKKCVELGIVPVPTTVRDENIDKEAIARLVASGNAEESSEEEEESEGEESDESESEEQEAAQSLLSLSQRYTNKFPGLLPSGRPTTYPYTLTFPTTTSASASVTTTISNAPLSSPAVTTQETTLVRNEFPRASLQAQDLRPAPNQDYKLCRQELRPPSREFKHLNHDVRLSQDMASSNNVEIRPPANVDNRPPSRDMILLPEYRHAQQPQEARVNYEMMPPLTMHEPAKIHEVSRPQTVEMRTVDRVETKHTDMTKQSIAESIKHTVARKMVVGGPGFRSPSPPTGSTKPQAEFLQPSNGPAPNYVSVTEDGRSVCGICNKVFSKPSQLRLHINIHYFERPYRCESCAVSFRTKGHLTKHERSVSHHNKVSMTSTFGAATTSNPRPFKCTDCKIAFRIHGHLAKHLRSKMHIMKLECLGKLPFGTYAEMERSGVNLNDIDTTDCDNSLNSLQMLAQKLCEKDPSKIGQWNSETIPSQVISGGETSSDEGEPIPQHAMHPYSVKVTDADMS
ncbi:unnamed protein product [Xylocopa violacea]|uniref:C2H2-type domain-containing protein n=1 Tax=Xylocopa violacea TaxID=135666 RepID=A0ABP1PAG0_XYLVO